MRDLELEMKMAKEAVCGITLTDLSKEMVKAFSNKELIPSIFPELNSPDFLESSQFAVILDTACFAALCSIRKANGMEVPAQGRNVKVQRGYKTELRLNDKQRTACLKHAGAIVGETSRGLHQMPAN